MRFCNRLTKKISNLPLETNVVVWWLLRICFPPVFTKGASLFLNPAFSLSWRPSSDIVRELGRILCANDVEHQKLEDWRWNTTALCFLFIRSVGKFDTLGNVSRMLGCFVALDGRMLAVFAPVPGRMVMLHRFTTRGVLLPEQGMTPSWSTRRHQTGAFSKRAVWPCGDSSWR